MMSSKKVEKKQDKTAEKGKGSGPVANPANPAVPETVRRKLKPEAILANVFGDLLKFSKKSPQIQAPFRKYDTLALHLAAGTREERILMSGFLFGLALTAHARRNKNTEQRKKMFDIKNRLFLALANKSEFRRVCNFRILQNKRFKVTKYCDDCLRKNTEGKLAPREWKYCSRCTVDRNFYDVLSMYHKFEEGGASLFLGNELLHEVRGLRNVKRMPFGLVEEVVTFNKYTYSPRTLVALDFKSCEAAALKVLDLIGKMGTDLPPDSPQDKAAAAYFQKGAAGFPPRRPGNFAGGGAGSGGYAPKPFQRDSSEAQIAKPNLAPGEGSRIQPRATRPAPENAEKTEKVENSENREKTEKAEKALAQVESPRTLESKDPNTDGSAT